MQKNFESKNNYLERTLENIRVSLRETRSRNKAKEIEVMASKRKFLER